MGASVTWMYRLGSVVLAANCLATTSTTFGKRNVGETRCELVAARVPRVRYEECCSWLSNN